MQNLTIIKYAGGCYIDSREVAELIGKRHDHLLRDIGKYCEAMRKFTAPKIGVSDFFIESTYLDRTGRTLPCFLISKMGCELVANKLTGEKGILFTAAYVKRFGEMEAAGRAARDTIQLPRLGEYNAAARLVVRAMQKIGATSVQVFGFLKSLYEPLGIAVEVDDLADIPQMYSAKQIAKMLGVYSLYGNPHAHAISCILNDHVFIGDEHKSIVTTDFGYCIGVSVRYDDSAVQSVRDWLKDYGYPGEIYGVCCTYHVLYSK